MATQFAVDLLFRAPKTPALDQLTRQLKELDQKARNIGGGDPFKPIEQGARGATAAVGGLMRALGPLAAAAAAAFSFQKIIGAAAEIETQTRAIQTLTGSLGATKQIMKELQDFGAITPFTSTELIDTAKRLKAFGVDTQNVVDTTKRLGDIAGATGANLGELATAYGQVQAKGRLQGEELLQFQERGVALGEELRKMYGDKFPKALEKGQISAKAVEVALTRLTEKGGQYAGGAINQSDTLAGKFSTLQDGITRLAAAIGTILTPALKSALDYANSALEEMLQRVNDLTTGSTSRKDRFDQASKQAEYETINKYGRFNTGTEAPEFLRKRREEIYRQKMKELSAPPKATAKADTTTPELLTGSGPGQEDKLLKLRQDTLEKIADLEKDAAKEVRDLQLDYIKEYGEARKDALKEIQQMEKDLAKDQLQATRDLEDAQAGLGLQQGIRGLTGGEDEKAVQQRYMEAFAGFNQRERDRKRSFEDKQRELATKLEDFKMKVAETIGKINLKFQENYGKNQLKYAETAAGIAETAARNAGEIQLEYATKAANITAAGGGGGAGGTGGGLSDAIDRIGGAYQFRGTSLAKNKKPGDYQSDPRENFFFDKRPELIGKAKARIATLTPADKAALAFTVLTEAGPTDVGKMDVAANLLVRSANLGNAGIGAVAKMPGQYEGVFKYTRPQIEDPKFGRKVFGSKYDTMLSMLSGGGGGGGGAAPGGGITTVPGVVDQQGRPVKLDKAAADSFARMVIDSAGKVKGSDIASAHRTPEKNRQVGGVEGSLHTKGLAMDIHGGSQEWIRKNGAKYGWKFNDYPGTHGGHAEYTGATAAAGGGGGATMPDYKANLKPYPKMPALLGTPDLTAELAPLQAQMQALTKVQKEFWDTASKEDLERLYNDLAAPIKAITADLDKQIKSGENLAAQEQQRLTYMQEGYGPALADQLAQLDAQGTAMRQLLDTNIAVLQLEIAKLDPMSEQRKIAQDLLDLAIARRDAIPGKTAVLRNQAVQADQKSKDPGAILTKDIAARQEKLDILMNPATQLISAAESIGDAFGQAFSDIASGSKTAGEAISDMIKGIGQSFIKMAAEILAQQAVLGILKMFAGSFGGGGGGGGGLPGFNMGGSFGGGGGGGGSFPLGDFTGAFGARANGGPVSNGKPYIVGEEGPEFFVPGMSGTILSNKDTREAIEGTAANAMRRYTPSNAATSQAVAREQAEEQRDGSGQPVAALPPIRVETTVINGVEYATAEQLRESSARAAMQGAKAGEARALRRLQQSPSARKRLGL